MQSIILLILFFCIAMTDRVCIWQVIKHNPNLLFSSSFLLSPLCRRAWCFFSTIHPLCLSWCVETIASLMLGLLVSIAVLCEREVFSCWDSCLYCIQQRGFAVRVSAVNHVRGSGNVVRWPRGFSCTVNYRYNVIRYNVIHGYYVILSVVPPTSI